MKGGRRCTMWKKSAVKYRPRTMFSCILNKMPLIGKEHREIIKIFYWTRQNEQRHCRNHGLYRDLWIIKFVWVLICKFEKSGCTCDRSRSGGPSVPVDTDTEVHEMISEVLLASACGVSSILQLPNSTIRKILHFYSLMFSYRFQHIPKLQKTDMLQRLNFENEFLIWHDENDCWPLHIQ